MKINGKSILDYGLDSNFNRLCDNLYPNFDGKLSKLLKTKPVNLKIPTRINLYYLAECISPEIVKKWKEVSSKNIFDDFKADFPNDNRLEDLKIRAKTLLNGDKVDLSGLAKVMEDINKLEKDWGIVNQRQNDKDLLVEMLEEVGL